MNKKLVSILTGISALAFAGIISFIPAKISHAATRTLNVVNNSGPTGDTISAELNFTYSGTTTPPDGEDPEIYIAPNQETRFIVICYFLNQQPSNASGTCAYSFTYLGVNYSGTLSLTNANPGTPTFFEGGILLDGKPSSVETEKTFEQLFGEEINNTIDDVAKAVQGLNPDGSVNTDGSVYYETPGAVNNTIIKAVADAKANITLIYTYQYQGYVFQSRITPELAAKLYSESIPWCGPCYVASNCPTVMIGVA